MLRRVDVSTAWGPDVVGRMPLDERRWAYGVRAPFDMAPGIPELMGGIVPNAPPSAIKEGDLIELLVVAV